MQGKNRLTIWTALMVIAVSCGSTPVVLPASTTSPETTTTTTTTTSTTTTSTTTTTTTSTTTTTTTTLPPPREATLLFTGDIIPHSPVVRAAAIAAEGTDRAHDFRPLFAQVTERIAAADLAICHLETPLTKDLNNLSGYPRFNAPVSLADDLVDIGYDACSTASNHVLDQWLSGAETTAQAFIDAGLGQTGISVTERDAYSPVTYDANGISVGHVSASFGFNGMPVPADTPWLVLDLEVDALLAAARRTRAVGAEFVVLSLHWGIEYRTAPTETQRQLAETLLSDPDVDLIIGHHAHVVQSVGMVGDEYVVYGLGNFLSNQSASCCAVGTQDGVMVVVNLLETADGVRAQEVAVTPTRVARSDGYRIRDVGASLSENPDSTELQNSWVRTMERLNAEDLGWGAPVATCGALTC